MPSSNTQTTGALLLLVFTVGSTWDLAIGTAMIDRTFGKSFQDCIGECANRTWCASVTYRRRYSICELFATPMEARNVPERERGSGVINTDVNKSAEVALLLREKCIECSTTRDCYVQNRESDGVCVLNMCGPPKIVVGARLLGNMSMIGSLRQYVCRAPYSDRKEFVSCGENGVWSDTNISCTNCEVPEIDHGTATLAWFDNETYQARVVCNGDYILRDAGTPTCLTKTGIWNETLLNLTCCDKPDVAPWKLIFRINSGFLGPIAGGYRFGRSFLYQTILEGCQYRDDSVFSNWGQLGIQRVKLELIKDDTVAAYMIFDGVGTNERDWMSIDRLAGSSWSDLMYKKEVGEPVRVSYEGQPLTDGQYHRFVVVESLSEDPEHCDSDLGWMYVTKSKSHPCHSTRDLQGTRIVYSLKGSNKLEAGPGIEYADKLEISVEF